MTVRAVLRYVSYVKHRHPSAETTATARCLNPDCQWTAAPTGSADVCTDMCIQHTDRTGHMTFLREFSEVAVVERARGGTPGGDQRARCGVLGRLDRGLLARDRRDQEEDPGQRPAELETIRSHRRLPFGEGPDSVS